MVAYSYRSLRNDKKNIFWLRNAFVLFLKWCFYSDRMMKKYLIKYLECLNTSELLKEKPLFGIFTRESSSYTTNIECILQYSLEEENKSIILSELFGFFHYNIGNFIINEDKCKRNNEDKIFDNNGKINKAKLASLIEDVKDGNGKGLPYYKNSKFFAENILNWLLCEWDWIKSAGCYIKCEWDWIKSAGCYIKGKEKYRNDKFVAKHISAGLFPKRLDAHIEIDKKK